MESSVVTVTIVGKTALSQSRAHDVPKLDGERPDDYDKRTWRSKLNISGNSVCIPAHGVMQALAAGAKYSKRQIPGQGKATWTQKFVAGIALLEDPILNIDPATVGSIMISANADGVRGSGKRVNRTFPIIPPGWKTTFDVWILDPIITEQIFAEILGVAGMFIGVGRFRPEKGGTNGRFAAEKIIWQDNRKMVA